MNPLLVVRATIARHLGTYVLFILLVAVATAIGVAITAQCRRDEPKIERELHASGKRPLSLNVSFWNPG